MFRLMMTLMAVTLLSTISLAQETKAANDASFQALKKEFAEANQKFRTEMQKEMQAQQEAIQAKITAAKEELKDAKTDEEKAAAEKKVKDAQATRMKAMNMTDGPAANFAPRFLAFAEKNPRDAAALDSLLWAMQTSGGSSAKNGIYQQAVKIVRSGYLDNENIKKLFPVLANSNDDDSLQAMRDIIAKHPDRKVQAKACKALANGLESAAQQAKMIQSNPEMRKNFEEQINKSFVEKLLGPTD